MIPIAAGVEPVQVFSLVVVFGIIVMEVLQMRQQPHNQYWFIPLLAWMIHGLIFYMVLFLDRADLIPLPFNPIYTEWSSILRLHGYLTIFAVEYNRWQGHRDKVGKHG